MLSTVEPQSASAADTAPDLASTKAILTVPFGWSPILTARVESTVWPIFGNWTFTDNGVVVAETAQNSNYVDVPAGSSWAKGEHNTVAHYSGDEQHQPSDSDVYHFTNYGAVNITADPPKTTLREGEMAQMTVHVTPLDAASGPVSGWVSFFGLDEFVGFSNGPKLVDPQTHTERSGFILGNAALDAEGSATFEWEVTPGAHYKVVAVYFGLDFPIHAQWFDKFRLPPVGDQVPSGWDSAVTAPVEFQSFKVINLKVKAYGPGTPGHPPIIAATVTDIHHQSQAWPEFVWTSDRQNAQAQANLLLQKPKPASKQALKQSVSLPGNGPVPVAELHYNVVGTLPAPPTGSINFMEGKKLLGVAPINSYGTAEFRPASLSAGIHNIKAVYAGDEHFVATEVTQRIGINRQPTSTHLSLPEGSLRQGTTVRTEVNVSAYPGVLARPGGWVLLTEGKETLARLRLGTIQTLNLQLTAGVHRIRATYVGDENLLTSQSRVWVVRVLKARQV